MEVACKEGLCVLDQTSTGHDLPPTGVRVGHATPKEEKQGEQRRRREGRRLGLGKGEKDMLILLGNF